MSTPGTPTPATHPQPPGPPGADAPDVALPGDAAPGTPGSSGAAALRLIDVEGAPPGTFGELEPTTPPLTDAQGRIRLSFSRVDAYGNCPRKFRFAYIDRLPSRPSPHLSFGSSIHAALEAFYDRKLPTCPTVDELLGFLYDHWDRAGFAGAPRDEQLAYYRHAQDVLRRFHARVAPTYRLPVVTEAWFELPVDDAVVVGSIDRVDLDDDGALHVIDYKTNRRASSRERVAGSLQLAIYALACQHLYGSLPASVALDFVVPGLTVRVDLAEIDLDGARATIRATAAAIRAGTFPPTPNRLCDWCDFRAACPAWPDDADASLGAAQAELDRLRRQLLRDVRAFREAEVGVARLRDEIASAESATAEGARADDQGA